ncbi:MAG: hypothetical protein AB7O98_15375 [Hyphomonadaceae bacterium]
MRLGQILAYVATAIGVVVSTSSVIKLFEFAYDRQFSLAVLRNFIDGYERLINLLDPPIEGLAGFLPPLAAHLPLQPHWNHVYVLLTLYFFRDAANFERIGYLNTAWASRTYGAAVAMTAALATGFVRLSPDSAAANFAVAAIPLAGLLTYLFGATMFNATWNREATAKFANTPVEPFWGFVWVRARRYVVVVAVMIALIAACLFVPSLTPALPVLAQAEAPGLVLLAAAIILLSLFWLYRGATQVKWDWRRFRGSGNILLGLTMLAPFVCAFAIMLAGG